MEEKGLVNIKSGFFAKITLFFRNMFKKNKVVEESVEISNVNENIQTEDELSESLQKLVVTGLSDEMKDKIEEEKLESLMSEVGNDKEKLRKLDLETLKKIDKQYDKKIEDFSYKISKLKTNLNTN